MGSSAESPPPHVQLDLTVDELLVWSPNPFYALDREWRFRYLNPAAEALLDVRSDEVVGRRLDDVFPGAGESPFGDVFRRAMRERLSLDVTAFYPPLGRWFSVHAVPYPAGLSVFFHDVSEHVGHRDAERRAEFQARLLDVAAVPVFAVDDEGRITYWNKANERLRGRTLEEVRGCRVEDLGLVDASSYDSAAVAEHVRRHGHWEGQITALDASGRRFPAALTIAVVRDEDGRPAGRVGTVFDLSEREAFRREIQAARDELSTITESIADGLLVLDQAGTITYANGAARELLRAGDLQGRPACEALYGSDDGEGARVLTARPGGRPAGDVFRRADGSRLPVEWTVAALPAAPDGARASGARVVVFRDATERHRREERLRREAAGLRWAKRLRQALDAERFELHGQPIVRVATGEAVDTELLIRLRAEDGSLVLPGDFLPAAEEHGLIRDIDRWVTRRAVELAAAGRAVHFNLSARSISDVELLVALRGALERTGADARLLTVELTETALLHDQPGAAAFARHVRGLGCRVALDDFGAGYNSFARIKDVPADVLKIDRQFVCDLLETSASTSVVRAIVGFASDLGLGVIAEGVEDAETADRLEALGVPHAQGYLFGRPAPLEAPGEAA